MTRATTTDGRKRRRKPATSGSRSAGRLQQVIDAAVKREIEKTLKETGGNMAEAARQLGISYQGLWSRLRSLDIDASRFRR